MKLFRLTLVSLILSITLNGLISAPFASADCRGITGTSLQFCKAIDSALYSDSCDYRNKAGHEYPICLALRHLIEGRKCEDLGKPDPNEFRQVTIDDVSSSNANNYCFSLADGLASNTELKSRNPLVYRFGQYIRDNYPSFLENRKINEIAQNVKNRVEQTTLNMTLKDGLREKATYLGTLVILNLKRHAWKALEENKSKLEKEDDVAVKTLLVIANKHQSNLILTEEEAIQFALKLVIKVEHHNSSRLYRFFNRSSAKNTLIRKTMNIGKKKVRYAFEYDATDGLIVHLDKENFGIINRGPHTDYYSALNYNLSTDGPPTSRSLNLTFYAVAEVKQQDRRYVKTETTAYQYLQRTNFSGLGDQVVNTPSLLKDPESGLAAYRRTYYPYNLSWLINLKQDVLDGKRIEVIKLAIMRQLLTTVQKLHENGVCHRTLRPEHILLTSDYKPIISDFGYFQSCGRNFGFSKRDVNFINPELLEKHGFSNEEKTNISNIDPDDDRKSDIWTLGKTFFDLWNGKVSNIIDNYDLFKRSATRAYDLNNIFHLISKDLWKNIEQDGKVKDEMLYIIFTMLKPRLSEVTTPQAALELMHQEDFYGFENTLGPDFTF